MKRARTPYSSPGNALRQIRKRALRARGFVAISATDAVIAFRVTPVPSALPPQVQIGWRGGQVHPVLQSRKECFTSRSSPEW